MHITATGDVPCFTTAAEANHMIDMARLRLEKPSVALIVDTLGIPQSAAEDQSIVARLTILRRINAAMEQMQRWKDTGSYLYDVNRWHNLDALWDAELSTISSQLKNLTPEELGDVQAALNEVS